MYQVAPRWGVVLCGGGAPAKEQLPGEVVRILATRPYVCAADSGYLHAQALELEVDFILGDMDSLGAHGLDYRQLGVPYRAYPKEKDLTDTQLAMQHLRQQGCERILQIGGGSGRPDQLFHHYHLHFSDQGADIWLSDLGQVYLVADYLQINHFQGRYLGVFALEKSAFTSEGLPHYLARVECAGHQYCSVCTPIESAQAHIRLRYGRVLVTISHAEPPAPPRSSWAVPR